MQRHHEQKAHTQSDPMEETTDQQHAQGPSLEDLQSWLPLTMTREDRKLYQRKPMCGDYGYPIPTRDV
jgi:hypothetical protein